MAYCVNCGAKLSDGAKFCGECGAKVPVMETYTYTTAETHYTGNDKYFDPEEVKKNKGMGVLSYLGLLVLVPLLAGDKNSEYVKFHSNQGLVLFIASKIVEVISLALNYVLQEMFGFYRFNFFSTIFDIVDFAFFILMIMGIVYACKGEKKSFPIIGEIKILK